MNNFIFALKSELTYCKHLFDRYEILEYSNFLVLRIFIKNFEYRKTISNLDITYIKDIYFIIKDIVKYIYELSEKGHPVNTYLISSYIYLTSQRIDGSINDK